MPKGNPSITIRLSEKGIDVGERGTVSLAIEYSQLQLAY